MQHHIEVRSTNEIQVFSETEIQDATEALDQLMNLSTLDFHKNQARIRRALSIASVNAVVIPKHFQEDRQYYDYELSARYNTCAGGNLDIK